AAFPRSRTTAAVQRVVSPYTFRFSIPCRSKTLESQTTTNEFSFYSFYGGFDCKSDHAGSLSFQEWLTYWHGDRHIFVRDNPTSDFKPILPKVLDAIASEITNLLPAERKVILIDSGGQTRTGIVCNHLRAVEDSSQFT